MSGPLAKTQEQHIALLSCAAEGMQPLGADQDLTRWWRTTRTPVHASYRF
jgi:hypothetical protein